MFVPNHHQQNAKRALSPSGPPPLRNQDPPTTPASSTTTKSPHTEKIIKRSRTDGTYSPRTTPRHAPPPPTTTATPKPPPVGGNQRPITPPKSEAPLRPLLALFTTQLDTLQITVSQLKKFDSPDPADVSTTLLLNTQSALSSLTSFVEFLTGGQETSQGDLQPPSVNPPNPPNTTTTTTYADTVKATTRTPASGNTSKTTHQKQAVKTAVPSSRHRHPSRVIFDLRHTDLKILQGNEPKVTPLTLRTSMNNGLLEMPNINVSISAVTFTKTGNVIITPTAPYTASQIISNQLTSVLLIAVIAEACGNEEWDPAISVLVGVYEDTPWHRVVIHGIPKETNDSQEEWAEHELYPELKKYNPSLSWPLGPKQGRDYRVLCRKEDWSQKKVVSVCLAFPDGAMARLAIRNGLAAFGAHCRVSPYRPLNKAKILTTAAC